jgi:hypothetical protein
MEWLQSITLVPVPNSFIVTVILLITLDWAPRYFKAIDRVARLMIRYNGVNFYRKVKLAFYIFVMIPSAFWADEIRRRQKRLSL